MIILYGATLAFYGAYILAGLRTPLPGQDQELAEGLTVEGHSFTTRDGLTLRLKRYANPDSIPILLCHGFGSNGFAFDIPRHDRNLAVFLAREGFDVWISSFRGCGRGDYISDGDWRHSIDHLAIYDAPALVDGVTSATGRRPFYIGHSMGGEVLYMYLQGVRFSENDAVVSDPELVQSRNESLLGGVTMGSPPGIWWPESSATSRVLHSAAGQRILEAMIQRMFRKEDRSPRGYKPVGAKRSLDTHPRLIMAASRGPAGAVVYYRPNTDRETTTCLARWATDKVSAGTWVQLLQGLAEVRFTSHPAEDPTVERYDYTGNMSLVTLPLLFLAGDKDMTHAGVERYHGTVSSEKNRFVSLQGYGHTDTIMGSNASHEVYPLLSKWIAEVAGDK